MLVKICGSGVMVAASREHEKAYRADPEAASGAGRGQGYRWRPRSPRGGGCWRYSYGQWEWRGGGAGPRGAAARKVDATCGGESVVHYGLPRGLAPRPL